MKMKKIMLFTLLGTVIGLGIVTALPTGAPKEVCESLLPSHKGSNGPQDTSSPYQIYTRNDTDYVIVILGSDTNRTISGFMLQGRERYTRQIIGTFQLDGSSQSHTLNCSHADDTVTHDNTNKRQSVTAYWLPPTDFQGEVIFRATIAESYSTFWVGIESKPISAEDNRQPGVINISPVLSIRPTSSTPVSRYGTQSGNRKKPTSEQDFDSFYSDCSVSKLCFGSPDGCVASKNCKAVSAIRVLGNKYVFEMKAVGAPQWVGVGLSDDAKMGQDSVIECVRELDSRVNAYMSWTRASPNYGADRLANPQLGIRLLNSSTIDDTIYCRVQRDAKTVVRDTTFNLVTTKYFILVASGSSIERNSVKWHDLVSAASGEAQLLSDVSDLKTASRLFVRLHGSFMLSAWIGTASIGILLARYYRKTWSGRTLFGKDIWFACHRILMVLTWLLTMTAFILIFLELQGWSAERNPHAICGTIVTILCFLQPIGAYFRPHPNTPKRPIFNWLHWLGGNSAHILAVPTLFFAVRLSKAELPDFTDWILVAFVGLHVAAHLILSFTNCVSDRALDRDRITSFSMKEIGPGGGMRHSTYSEGNETGSCGGFRKFVLAIFVICIICLTVALVVITALAPIEQSWQTIKSKMMNI